FVLSHASLLDADVPVDQPAIELPVPEMPAKSVFHRYVDFPYQPLWLGPFEIDRKEPVLQLRTDHAHAVGQHERALQLARCDAPVQELALGVVILAATDDELVFLGRHLEIVFREAGHCERYAQPVRLALAAPQPFDVVGWIR